MDCCDLFQVGSEMMTYECTESLEGQFADVDFRVDEAVLKLVRDETACFNLRDMVDAYHNTVRIHREFGHTEAACPAEDLDVVGLCRRGERCVFVGLV